MEPDFDQMLEDIEREEYALTDWERGFIDDMSNVEYPSEPQMAKIRQIWEQYCG